MTDTLKKSVFMEKQVICGLVFIPLTAAIGAFGLSLAITRIVALLSGLQLGVTPYISLLLTALTAAGATVIRTVFNLPFTLRVADLAVSYGITLLLLKITGPITPGIIKYTETVHVMQGDQLLLLTCTAAWVFTNMLTHVVKYIIPWQWLVMCHPDLAQRIREEQFQRIVYQKKHAEMATNQAWHGVYRLMGILFAVMFIAAVFGGGAAIAGDSVLASAGLVAIFGLLIYMALVQLSARHRLLEQVKWVKVPSKYGAVWVQAALLPVLIAIVLGGLLPANWSPLSRLDATKVGNWLGLVFYQALRGKSYNYFSATESLQRLPILPAGGAGSGMGGLVILSIYGIIIALLIFGIRSIWLLSFRERERARQMWRLLFAILTLPLRILVLMIVGFFKRVRILAATGIKPRTSTDTAAASGKHSPRTREKRILPSSLVLYIRYMYARLLKEAAKGGIQRRQQETALEFAQRLARSVPDAEVPAQAITQVYCHVRYTEAYPPESWRLEVLRLYRRVTQGLRRRNRKRPLLGEGTQS